MIVWRTLIEESRELDDLASRIDGTDHQRLLHDLEEQYGEWYASCLALLPADLRERFQAHYDTGDVRIGSTTIKAFLNGRTYPPGPQYVAAGPGYQPRGMSFSWSYAYHHVFHPHILDQRIILIEASKRVIVRDEKGDGMTTTEMQQVVQRLINGIPQPSDDTSAAYDWLLQVEVLIDHVGPHGKTFEKRLAQIKSDYENQFSAVTLSPDGDVISSHIATTESLLQGGLGVLHALLQAIESGVIRTLTTQSAATSPSMAMRSPAETGVFIVHGHDNEAKETVARVLERLGLSVTILHEQTDEGRTLIEKFEQHAGRVTFAVILLTPDDMGAAKANTTHLLPRARQNVVLELGYFYGKLGRKNVCSLYKDGVELPSDMSGIVYTLMDAAGEWKYKLARELKAARIDVDLNRVP